MHELTQRMSRGAFLKRMSGLLVVAVIPSDAVLRTFAALPSLDHPDPRPGITAEHVLSVEALSSIKSERVKDAYEWARTYPAIFDGIACGCGCGDRNKAHRSLLVCYETAQPTGCQACRDEAQLVARLAAKDTPLADIRTAVDKKFG
jgi:hypothetical protein